MKTKFFKVLSVMLTLAMVFSMFACVAHAEEAIQDVVLEDGVYSAMMQGNIYKDGTTGELVVQTTNSQRICTVNTYNVADYTDAVIASGFRANFVFLDAQGGFVNNVAWKTGTVNIASIAGGAPTFRVVISADPDVDPFTTDMFPADGLKLVAKAEEPEEGAIVLLQGTILGTGKLHAASTDRIHVAEFLKIADYASVTIADGYNACYYVYDEANDDAMVGSSSGWQGGTYTAAQLQALSSDAVYFRFVLKDTTNPATFAPADFPEDGLTLTPASAQPEEPEEPEEVVLTYTPEMAQGNVKTAEGKLVLDPNQKTRITSKELISIFDTEKVEIGTGFKAWYYTYKADGTLTNTGGCGAWKTGTYTADDLQKISAEGVYFSVTVAYENNADIAPSTLPEGACVVTNVTRPEMAQGNVKTAEGKLVLNPGVGTRVTTKELLPIADYKKVKIGAGYKAWYYTYDAEGKLTDANGCGSWQKGDYTAMALMGLSDKGVYFSVTVAYENDVNVTPATLPKEAFGLVKAPAPVIPEMGQGNVKTAEGKLVLDPNQKTRITTTKLHKLADYEKIKLAPGYKAWYYVYKADETLVPGTGAGAWIEGDYAVNKLAALSADAVYFSVTVAEKNNADISPATLPEGTLKLIVVGAYGACLEHDIEEYTSNNDATCLEDGTKSGVCKVCSLTITIKDEFSATGHIFDNDEDMECNVCSEARPAPETCEHKYGEYISDKNAECEKDGTKTAACLKCGNKDTVEDKGSALEHKVEYVSDNNADCDSNCTESGVCSLCNKLVTRDIPNSMLGHEFASDDDSFCAECGYERKKLVYYLADRNLTGIDTNDGSSYDNALATIDKAIQLAKEAGAGVGDIVTLNLKGTVEWGGSVGVSDSWRVLTAHEFKVICKSEDGSGIAGDGQKNMILGGQMVFDSVILNGGNSWKTVGLNGFSTTINKPFASDMFDLALAQRANLDVNQPATFTFNMFFPKIFVGGTYGVVNYNKEFNLLLNKGTDGDNRPLKLMMGGGNSTDYLNFNGPANIIAKMPNALTFDKGALVKIGENGFFNVINHVVANTVAKADMGLTAEAAAKTWVLNFTSPVGSLEPTDKAGEFKVESGYIATATPLEGEAITSAEGVLTLETAAQYAISFVECPDHVFDGETDAVCNNCGFTREVFLPCEHEWSEYVFDNNANCETLGTETRTCALCYETETRPIEGVAPGHTFTDDADIICNVCGAAKDAIADLGPTLVKGDDGVYYYYNNGINDMSETLVKYKGQWFYVNGGKWVKTKTMVKYQGQWFYVESGKWKTGVETLCWYKGYWFFIQNGKWAPKSQLTEYKGVLFLVQKGKWDKSVITLTKKNGKYYSIKWGKWTKDEMIIDYKGAKFYVNKGYAQLSYSGTKKIGGKTYTIKKGKVVKVK